MKEYVATTGVRLISNGYPFYKSAFGLAFHGINTDIT